MKRKGAGASRGASNELLRLFQQMGASVFRLDARTLEVRFLGPSVHPDLGISPGVFGRGFWAKAVPAEDLLPLREAIRAVAEDGAARAVDHRFQLDGRGPAWVRTCLIPSSPQARFRHRLIGSMLDITSSRENERQWRDVESWLAAVGEALPFDFWICDRDGRCVLQNPASVRHQGERVGESIDLPGWSESFARALAGETVRSELEAEGPGGRRFVVRVITPAGAEGEIRGALAVDIDVTELKETEARLRQSLRELALAQGALVRSSQLAALGEMAAVVAHQVRNPLGSIVNAASLLRKDGGPSGFTPEELIGIIRDEAASIEWLVHNLLELARPMTPKLSPQPLAVLLEEALAQTLRAEPANAIQVTRKVDPELGEVPVDPHLLQMALTNVFQNAVQAMGGQGELALGVERELAEDGSWARLTIRDSGPGISPEHQERVFEPFFTTRSSGNGLGLAIIKRVVLEHRGTVELTSEPGQGTSCVIRLPLEKAD